MNEVREIGKKIAELMDKNNVSLRSLAQSIGITHPTLKNYIDGNSVIDSSKLLLIAEYFNVDFDYFFNKNSDSHNLLFRANESKERIGEKDIAEIKNLIKLYMDLGCNNNYIPPEYNFNYTKVTEDVEEKIENIADGQRRFSGIEETIPDNYYKILSEMGINIIIRKLENTNIYGTSLYVKGKGSYIVINDSEGISEERKLFTLIHEYAHLLFDKNKYYASIDNNFHVSKVNEKIANAFAGYFLLPRGQVSKYIMNNKTVSEEGKESLDSVAAKQYFKVSEQALYYAFKKYNIISADYYKKYCIELNRNQMRKTEPDQCETIPFEDKNIVLINKLKDLYFQEKISINKISEVLDYNLIATRKLIKKWGETIERHLDLR